MPVSFSLMGYQQRHSSYFFATPPMVQFPQKSPSIHTTAFRSFKSSRSAWRRFTQNKRSNRNSGCLNPDMYEILAYLPYQLVQDFFHQQYASLRPLPQTLMQYSRLFSFFSLLGVRICVHNPESPLGTSSWSPMKEHCGRLQIILAVTSDLSSMKARRYHFWPMYHSLLISSANW